MQVLLSPCIVGMNFHVSYEIKTENYTYNLHIYKQQYNDVVVDVSLNVSNLTAREPVHAREIFG